MGIINAECTHCPVCGSTNVTITLHDEFWWGDEDGICNDCGAEWILLD